MLDIQIWILTNKSKKTTHRNMKDALNMTHFLMTVHNRVAKNTRAFFLNALMPTLKEIPALNRNIIEALKYRTVYCHGNSIGSLPLE